MFLSQIEFEDLIKRLQTQKTESATMDAKVELHLKTDGDKADFIHHVAALANNVIPSFLIIGIENKSWNIKGLDSTSPLLDSDKTQTRMNQILEHKLDPQLSIRYRTYNYEDLILGLVEVEGSRAPYLIAINDENFGGKRTKGSDCYIQRGVLYVRNGDSTTVANRQSRIHEILAQREKFEVNTSEVFLSKNNYADIDSEQYGENDLTRNLVEIISSKTPEKSFDIKTAKSWVSIAYVPISSGCHIDTAELPSKLQPDKRIGRGEKWFYGLPRPVIEMLWQSKGTPHMLSGKWFPASPDDHTEYTHAINILPSGGIHLAVTHPLFYERPFEGLSSNVRFYSFVNLIGYYWQITYLARAIIRDVDYHGDTLVLLTMLGTSGTYLLDLAKGDREKWISLGDWQYNPNSYDQAQEKHIRIERTYNLVDSSDDDIESLIRGVASEIGKYYNQPTPRCFTPDADKFPVNEYNFKNSR